LFRGFAPFWAEIAGLLASCEEDSMGRMRSKSDRKRIRGQWDLTTDVCAQPHACQHTVTHASTQSRNHKVTRARKQPHSHTCQLKIIQSRMPAHSHIVMRATSKTHSHACWHTIAQSRMQAHNGTVVHAITQSHSSACKHAIIQNCVPAHTQ